MTAADGILDGPLLWFLNRGTGITLMALLSASTALGVMSMGGRVGGKGGSWLPRFVSQKLHRNLALLSVVALVVHVITAVVDTYVDIRWWQAVVPFGATYQPLWLGLGAVSLDLILLVTITAMLRGRLGQKAWRSIHYASWGAWLTGIVHGIGIGTDLHDPSAWAIWAILPALASIGVVGAALLYRLLRGRREPVGPIAPASDRSKIAQRSTR